MKRAVDDLRSGTNSNSPPDNGKSKKSKLSHADSQDFSEESSFLTYGTKAKIIKEIVSIRRERLNVVPKLESISPTESSCEQSTFADNALGTASAPVEVDEEVLPQSGEHSTLADNSLGTASASVGVDEDVLPQSGEHSTIADNALGTASAPIEIDEEDEEDEDEPYWGYPTIPPWESVKPLVSSEVKTIDRDWFSPFKGNENPDLDNKSPMSTTNKSRTSRERSLHEILDETKSQVVVLLDGCKGSEECPNGDGKKGPEIPSFDKVAASDSGANPETDGNDHASDGGATPETDGNDTASDGGATPETDGLDDMWMEFGLAIEHSKGNADFENSVRDDTHKEPTEDCEHSLILRDDIGHVCRICGKVEMDIQQIFEFQYKTARSSRTYKYEPRSKGNKDLLEIPAYGIELPEDEVLTNFSAHPMHAKKMRPHQLEGFRFLARNLVSDKPSGCILAHAPGSGKTFMIISFIQSFMARYPNARPLIVLPKSILSVWKTEFMKWQIEDMPLYDLYASKTADHLDVLTKWVKDRSILFMGYAQFSSIVSGGGNKDSTPLCQKILSEAPSLLILDEGHTPRNNETEIVNCISKVKTARKVVLSGTLYQNHVREVFNILNLVHPKFLQSEMPKEIVKRIMSRVDMGGKRISKWSDGSFHDLVEKTLQSDDPNIKLHVIKDLREMTKNILHYYKGDILDDLPGLDDYTVVLNLTERQWAQTKTLKRIDSLFKRSSVGSAVYLHPDLKPLTDSVQANKDKQTALDDATYDRLVKEVDINDGVKAKFFLNVLRLCQVTKEKLLVFSQYLLPLKFLERLTVEVMNWCPGLEIFMITGDSTSEMREMAMKQFNDTPSAKVFFGSIKACGEGISLVGASRVIILDVHPNPSVTRQAIGRAFRPGQEKKVYVYRLIAAKSMEEDDHHTYFRKELISKLWFEWNEHRSMKDFELKEVEVDDCGDKILESPHIHSDVKALYKR